MLENNENCCQKLQEHNFVNSDIQVNKDIVDNVTKINNPDIFNIPNPCLSGYENRLKRLEKLVKLQSIGNVENDHYNKLMRQFHKEKNKGNSVFSVRIPSLVQKELRKQCEQLEISVAEGVWIAFSLFLKQNK